MTQTNNQQNKKAYRSPKLTNYGDVRTLTQAGSGKTREAGSNKKNKKYKRQAPGKLSVSTKLAFFGKTLVNIIYAK